MNRFYEIINFMLLVLKKMYFRHMSAMTGSNEVQSGNQIFDHFNKPLGLYMSNNTSNVDFQIVHQT